MKNEPVTPFRIDVAEELLTDLRQRLKNTRRSHQLKGTHWEAGTDLRYLKELIDHWQSAYDWRRHEAALNRFAHFKTEVGQIASISSMRRLERTVAWVYRRLRELSDFRFGGGMARLS